MQFIISYAAFAALTAIASASVLVERTPFSKSTSFALTERALSSGLPILPRVNGHNCTVIPLGNKKDDVPQILAAFSACNNGGTVIFPEGKNYWIASRLNPVITDVTIVWKGQWTFSDNLAYWRNNSYFVAFQNHRAAFVLTGDRIHIDGYNTGGIFGNGNAWYNAEKAVTLVGRPMPFVFWNVTEVTVENFYVKDPALWALNIMGGTNMWFKNILCNATATSAPWGTNWVQNTDGFNTMDANNIKLTNFYYQGGDDCIAIKPRSYNISVQNVTCHGGNGIAIGSLGQYLEDSSVINVVVKDVNILTYNLDMHNAAYIKTWIKELLPQSSYESGGVPRGGGWGVVKNIRFENFFVQGASAGPTITQNNGDNGHYAGTSLMEISNISYVNWTGYVNAGSKLRTASISCSSIHPCSNISFQNVTLAPSISAAAKPVCGTTSYTAPGGVTGLLSSCT